MRSLAVISMHTSPLAQPGTGDGGGMNVYVRQLSAALARSGVDCAVYTRAWSDDLPPVVQVEPGLSVHHVPAGPLAPVAKEAMADLAGEMTEGILARMRIYGVPDAIHANYWLSGLAGHAIKHELSLPLVSTFHTLDRVKAEASAAEVVAGEPARRADAEARIIGCSDAVLASCKVEADQLAELYGAEPARVEIVAPGVDHAFFAPGNRAQARKALGLPASGPMLLFVGRIQPLKGADVAISALARLRDGGHGGAFLAIVGGPSGPQGVAEMERLRVLAREEALGDKVRFVRPQPHELLSSWYRAADVCLVPSRSESFGLVALEAAACGTPVVAAAVGGLRTLVEHARTGFLVDGRDPAAFAAYAACIVEDGALARSLSERAAVLAARYTWAEAAARLRRIYARLTERALVECA